MLVSEFMKREHCLTNVVEVGLLKFIGHSSSGVMTSAKLHHKCFSTLFVFEVYMLVNLVDKFPKCAVKEWPDIRRKGLY